MKRNSFIRLCLLPLLFAMVALFPACKKNSDGAGAPAPVVTSVRLYAPSPNDVVLSSGNIKSDTVYFGKGWVAITGHNLQNATEIDFDGVPATFNTALFAPNSAVVQIPNIMFSKIDTTKLYTLQYKTKGGSTTFSFKFGPGLPTITAISNVFANPGDSVYLYGSNLVLVKQFLYGGVPVSSYKYSADGTALGFLMPATTSSDQVSVTTVTSTVNFKIVATPTITGISNENASPGDSVYIYGTYLKGIQSLSFAGTAVNSFISAKDGSSVGFVLPTLTKSGPVSVTTTFGAAATIYNVNDIGTGAISNWEWSGRFNWEYWGGANVASGNPSNGWPPYTPDFPGDPSQFMTLKTGLLSGGEGNTYSSYAIRMGGTQWVPAGNMNDPISNYAFKFEVSIPKGWNGGTIDIISSQGSYVARWEPWNISATKTAPYATKRWITVTIPMSAFRAPDPTLGEGEGVSISKFADLLGSSGNSECIMYIHNYSTSTTSTGFYGAFDNVRVVKIK